MVIKSSDAPKPGKQRLGPRKKKLSTLKKKILLDRLERWREIQQEGLLLASTPADVGGQDVCPPSLLFHLEAGASPLPPAGTPCGGNIDECSAGGSGGGGGGGQRRLWVIAIYNLVEEEDVEDMGDHAEIERDLWEMASTFGVVRRVEVPRGAAHFDGPRGLASAKVAFATADEAQDAKRGFNGRVVSGKVLHVEIEESDNFSGDASASGSLHAPAGGLVWRVAVENLIDEEDDLDDEDEYAEVCADISAMMGVHGTPIEVDIPREKHGESEKGIGGRTNDGAASTDEAAAAAAVRRVVVVTFGSLEEAEACVKDTNGRRVGGKELNAKLTVGQSRARSESSGGTKQRRDESALLSTTAGREPSTKPAGALTTTSPPANAESTTAGGATWRVVIRNLIDEDDLIDDDDYSEVRADATALVSAYGAVTRLCIPRDPQAAPEEEADAYDGAEPGEAVAVFGSLEEAEACARGLSGRKIAGKNLDAHVSQNSQPSKPGMGTAAPAEPRNIGALLEQPPTKGALPQSSRRSVAPHDHGSGSGMVRGVKPPAAGAGAGAQPGRGVATPASIDGGKIMPTKYKEAASLPKPPGMSGGGSPNSYVYQVRLVGGSAVSAHAWDCFRGGDDSFQRKKCQFLFHGLCT